jgi:hypothetical protein
MGGSRSLAAAPETLKDFPAVTDPPSECRLIWALHAMLGLAANDDKETNTARRFRKRRVPGDRPFGASQHRQESACHFEHAKQVGQVLFDGVEVAQIVINVLEFRRPVASIESPRSQVIGARGPTLSSPLA